MRIKQIFLATIISLSFLFFSCSDAPSPIGADLLDADQIIIEQVNSFTDTIPQSSVSILTHVPLGSSNRLLIGRHQNVEASFLIRFAFAFPDSIKQELLNNTLNVNSARVEFTKLYTFGDNSGALDISIQRVLSSWGSGSITSDSLPGLQTASITTDSLLITDSVTTFKFENSVALEWLKNTADPGTGSNWGLYLKPGPSSEKIIGYQALISSAQNIPKIQLIVEKPGVWIDTLIYNPVADATLLDSIAPYPSGDFNTIQSGLRIMTYLKYDISIIPQFAVINKAELILTSDTTQNISGDPDNNIAGYIPRDSVTFDSISSATIIFTKTGSNYTGDITSLVQDWLSRRDNRGLVLTTSNELNGLERFVIYGSNATNPALRPRLIVTYTNKL